MSFSQWPPGEAKGRNNSTEAGRGHTQTHAHTGVYHEVPQLQASLAAVEEGVPLSDDGAL